MWQNPSVLGARYLVTLATPAGVQIDAAEHHRERGRINLDGQRRSIPAVGELEAPAFETLRPHDQTIAIPEEDLAAIACAIHKDEVITPKEIHGKRLLDDRGQTIETLH